MAIGFKLDAKSGEPLHLVFAGTTSYEDYVDDGAGGHKRVMVTTPESKPQKDEWYPDDFDSAIAALTAPAEVRPSFAQIRAGKIPVMDRHVPDKT